MSEAGFAESNGGGGSRTSGLLCNILLLLIKFNYFFYQHWSSTGRLWLRSVLLRFDIYGFYIFVTIHFLPLKFICSAFGNNIYS